MLVKKFEEVAERLLDDLHHNRISDFEEWSKKLYAYLDEAFPEAERVGQYVADVETICHNRLSFGFCDLCGEVILYEDDTWYDLCMLEGDEPFWLERTLPIVKQQPDRQNDVIADVCGACFHKLCSEDGFRSIALTDREGATGGKSHANETLGEFLDEAGLKASDDTFDIDFALYINGIEPLYPENYPFIDDKEKMVDFAELSKERFLESYSYLTETEYDMTKKVCEYMKGEK